MVLPQCYFLMAKTTGRHFHTKRHLSSITPSFYTIIGLKGNRGTKNRSILLVLVF